METTPPTLDEMQQRFNTIKSKGFPYIVAIQDDDPHDKVIGYAYANTFRGREGFNNTVEISIYLRHDKGKRGVGR